MAQTSQYNYLLISTNVQYCTYKTGYRTFKLWWATTYIQDIFCSLHHLQLEVTEGDRNPVYGSRVKNHRGREIGRAILVRKISDDVGRYCWWQMLSVAETTEASCPYSGPGPGSRFKILVLFTPRETQNTWRPKKKKRHTQYRQLD